MHERAQAWSDNTYRGSSKCHVKPAPVVPAQHPPHTQRRRKGTRGQRISVLSIFFVTTTAETRTTCLLTGAKKQKPTTKICWNCISILLRERTSALIPATTLETWQRHGCNETNPPSPAWTRDSTEHVHFSL